MELMHKTSLFSLFYDKEEGVMVCKFKSKADALLYMQMDMFSKLLSSYSPDSNGVWQSSNRMSYEIVGWPKSYVWARKSDKIIYAPIDYDKNEMKIYGELLGNVFPKIKSRKSTDQGEFYQFTISGNGDNFEYQFNDRARVIAALCVLFDLEPHERDHLEINIPWKYIKNIKWPIADNDDDRVVRFYGDPSKTADVLRNEGWSREGDNPHMFVYRENIGGQQQQMYKIDSRSQTIEQQVKRTVIKSRWKRDLFKAQDYKCRICRLEFPEEQLSPDHRVPVIFEADNLTDDNYREKLMTLCRFCNQQKREFAKRVDASYDWSTSQWAYPEQYMIKAAAAMLHDYAEMNDIEFRKAVKLLVECDRS